MAVIIGLTILHMSLRFILRDHYEAAHDGT